MGREHLETGGADAPPDDRNMGKAVTGLESNPVTAHEINNIIMKCPEIREITIPKSVT